MGEVKDMEIKLTRVPGRYITTNEILEDIRRVDRILNDRKLTKSKFNQHSKISVNTVISRFGTWHNALLEAGLAHKSVGAPPPKKLSSPQSKHISNEEIVAELKRVSQKLGKNCITRFEFDKNSETMSSSTVSTRFGSWEIGINKASLTLSPTAKRYTKQECFENLLRVWEHCGRQPTKDMMDQEPSFIRSGTYKHKWGSWYSALKAFVESANGASDQTDDDVSEEEIKYTDGKKQQPEFRPALKRSIGWRLRYNVLKRDSFKCVLCGNSPATDQSCRLHIDHIHPFSKGGKTEISNLRTLCHVCNIGKGDTVESKTP